MGRSSGRKLGNYYSYDTNGNPTVVYSSFEDIATNTYTSARQTTYDYTSSPVSGSGDDDTISPNIPREVIQFIGGNEVSRVFNFSFNWRADRHAMPGDGRGWNATGNLFTTNLYYTSGLNFLLCKL